MPNLWDQEELRKLAKERLAKKKKPAEKATVDEGPLSEEIRIHQTELEIQNRELRRALAYMESSREKYYNLYDSAPVGYLTISSAGFIREANIAASKLLGIERERLNSRPLIRFIAVGDRLHLDRLFKRIAEKGEKQSCELRLVDAQNRLIHVRLEGIMLKKICSEPDFLIAVIDLTREDESDHKLQSVFRELEEANEVLKGEITERERAEEGLKKAKMQAELYLDLMGHDISNMHQIAMGQLELAKNIMDEEGGLKAEDRELIETPLETLERSAGLVENVRNLQKLGAGEFKAESIDLNGLLFGIVKDYEPNVHAIRFTGDGLCYVMANRLLHDVFSNLVGNAIKHSNGNGVDINIKLENASENGKTYYRASVEDNGSGISDDLKDRIFNRLHRGETKARGLGLGLYLVKTLVESYHGRVWVEDRVMGDHTKGARFVVVLPAIEK